MCVEIRISAPSLSREELSGIADECVQAGRLRVSFRSRGLFRKRDYLALSEEGGCACSMMANDLMFAEVRLQQEWVNPVVETLTQLGPRLGDDWTFEAFWGPPSKEEAISLEELVTIVQRLTIPEIRYVIGAGKPNARAQRTASSVG